MMLETSVLVQDEKGKFDPAERLRAYGEEKVENAAITLAELLHVLERADTEGRRHTRQCFIDEVVARVAVIPSDASVARQHARLWSGLAKQGMLIGPYDPIIAATVLERDAELWTFNTDEFSRVPGLRIRDPRSR